MRGGKQTPVCSRTVHSSTVATHLRKNRMKDKNHLIRLIIILGIGTFLSYRIYQFRFSSFLFDVFIVGGISIIGFLFWIWSIRKDYKKYKATKNKRFWIGGIIGIVFIGLIFGIYLKNNAEFNKPTLVRVYYDGDFNGTSIDFKTDGTYIFDNFAIGFSDYVHGNYKINGQLITLDKKEIDNVIKTDLLEIKDLKENGIDHLAGKYLFQIESNGKEIERSTKFRVVIDNRK
ncbi:hypothetical protein KO500_00075 [Cellulophaga baltica]|uniref:hypothetical protein n=1 Tax=Cellulophaga TaxID=104264 RepID=UPI001C071C6C|nr:MULTISPECIES: hypothetical protein [Cellulophaga]MBU2994810.1 hypothetical protein [Cellulophaga baltica]MDO6766205.1 hypothetical protein [Cellulophaga sp. 1_MG-2023]